MQDEGTVPGWNDFADFARSRGVRRGFAPRHGAEAVEIMNLIETVEETGDELVRILRSGRDRDNATILLERLLECYSDPLRNSRALMQIRMETRKLGK